MFEKGLVREFWVAAVVMVAALAGLAWVSPWWLIGFVVVGPIVVLGAWDCFQTRHAVLRNYPLVGHFRFLFEEIRPEIRQYFVESDLDGRPFNRRQRTVIYTRAKREVNTLAYGSLNNFYDVGYEWVNHSLVPVAVDPATMRVVVGGPDCTKPYSASLLNVSAMSFGALSSAAVRALNGGAKLGEFAHNTGEGGLSPYHLEAGGDLIWQLGTGYFGCRGKDGDFDGELYAERSQLENVKMVELKLSQGAKPGHGGILPAKKVTPEIAEIRGVPMGEDVMSPPAHKAFTTPIEMMEFVAKLRELSGGKPIGIKLCIGKRREFMAMCKAMVETGIAPDYIAIDGGEGGTGAAPPEFAGSIGCPGIEALIFAHNCLVGFDLRDKVRLINAGKITMGIDLIVRLALGADLCYAARSFMMSIGCIQALKCNLDVCPVGVTTQNPRLVRGLHVGDKRLRCAQFHETTLQSVAEILGAMGLATTADLRPWHIMRRINATEIRHYGEIFSYLEPGALLREPLPAGYERAVRAAQSQSFGHASPDKPRVRGDIATWHPDHSSYR